MHTIICVQTCQCKQWINSGKWVSSLCTVELGVATMMMTTKQKEEQKQDEMETMATLSDDDEEEEEEVGSTPGSNEDWFNEWKKIK